MQNTTPLTMNSQEMSSLTSPFFPNCMPNLELQAALPSTFGGYVDYSGQQWLNPCYWDPNSVVFMMPSHLTQGFPFVMPNNGFHDGNNTSNGTTSAPQFYPYPSAINAMLPTECLPTASTNVNNFNYNNDNTNDDEEKSNEADDYPSDSNKVGGYSRNILYKTMMCNDFAVNGQCPRGAYCQFAHGEAEIQYPENHPLYKTALCKDYKVNKECPRGEKCFHIHELSEQRPKPYRRPNSNFQPRYRPGRKFSNYRYSYKFSKYGINKEKHSFDDGEKDNFNVKENFKKSKSFNRRNSSSNMRSHWLDSRLFAN